jgi:2-polyprenyl-3-methyl-5-hydroxy-6-metoxy-1,4-benzoquinol methylase
MSSPFRELLDKQWDLRMFCYLLGSNFATPDTFDSMVERAAQRLDPLGSEWLRGEVRRWRSCGLLPEPDGRKPDWVGLLWQSPLFQGLLGSISFYPEAQDSIAEFLPPPAQSIEELAARRDTYQAHLSSGRMGRGEVKYWQEVLQVQAPELYLDPFLPAGALQGCDVACGWGRICLGLRDYTNRHVLAYDLAQAGLDRLQSYARAMGLSDRVQPVRSDVFALPLSTGSIDFFLAFDIFEHLETPDVARLLGHLLDKARPGAVLYAEIPLESRSLALTHLQNWNAAEVQELFCSVERDGKRWRLALHDRRVPDHFSFVVGEAS